jgi:hypothetical protein
MSIDPRENPRRTGFILFGLLAAIMSSDLGIRERVAVIVLFGLIGVALSRRYVKS